MEEITTISKLEDFLQGIAAKKAYPKGLQLNLSANEIGVEVAKVLAIALQSRQCPPGLQLNLAFNKIGTVGAKALAIALQSGQCPQGLRLDLYGNQLGADGAKVLALALQSGRCPQGLQLILGGNQIGVEGAKALALALQSGRCPQGLQLDLNNNWIGAEGAKALALVLQCGQCPQGLQLNLSANEIGVEVAKALAIALQSGQCPQGLQLNLSANEIGVEGAKALAIALQSRQCPQGLQLDLRGNQISNEQDKSLKAAWAVYYAHQQDNFINCMTLYQGHGQVDSLINRLPPEMLQEICRHVLPVTPILAKMTEISTKVFWAQWATLKLADNSALAKQFDNALATALLSKRFTEKAAKIKTAITNFLAHEWETMDSKKLVPSPTVALLCKYHLLAKHRVHQDPNQSDHFYVNELPLKKSTF